MRWNLWRFWISESEGTQTHLISFLSSRRRRLTLNLLHMPNPPVLRPAPNLHSLRTQNSILQMANQVEAKYQQTTFVMFALKLIRK